MPLIWPAPYWPRTTQVIAVLRVDRLDGAQDFHLFVAQVVRAERVRRLHGDQGQHLQGVALHHVAQLAGMVEVARPRLDADRLGDRHLDVVNETAVPERLKQGVGEPKHEDVLDRLFAEIMVNAIDLFFGEDGLQFGVQLPGRVQVGAERLLDDDAREARAVLPSPLSPAPPGRVAQ